MTNTTKTTEKTIPTIDHKTYLDLLNQHLPKRIETEEENNRALELVDILLCQKERTLEEEALLDLWSILIEEFEERYNFPDTQGDEVEVLVCLMDAHSMTQADLVSKLNLGSSGVVSQILNRKRGISKTQAKKLANYFHGDASLFI